MEDKTEPYRAVMSNSIEHSTPLEKEDYPDKPETKWPPRDREGSAVEATESNRQNETGSEVSERIHSQSEEPNPRDNSSYHGATGSEDNPVRAEVSDHEGDFDEDEERDIFEMDETDEFFLSRRNAASKCTNDDYDVEHYNSDNSSSCSSSSSVSSSSSSAGSDGSLDELLQIQIEHISRLEQSKKDQEERINTLTNQMNDKDARNKHQVFLLNIELRKMWREKEACEDRLAEMFNDMQDLAGLGRPNESCDGVPPSTTSGVVLELATKLKRYECAIEVLKNQMKMMKVASDEISNSLKQELAELSQDRIDTEVDLLNQLAFLNDNEKQLAAKHAQEVQIKDDAIQQLRREILIIRRENEDLRHQVRSDSTETGSQLPPNGLSLPQSLSSPVESDSPQCSSSSTSCDSSQDSVEGLKAEVSWLRGALKAERGLLDQERSDSDKLIGALEDDLRASAEQLDEAHAKLDAVNAKVGTEELENMHSEQTRIEKMLERITGIWEHANTSLEEIELAVGLVQRDSARKFEGASQVSADDGAFKPIFLLQNEIKVSLMLAELKLRNMLISLTNDDQNPAMICDAMDDDIQERIDAVRESVVTQIHDVEHKLDRGIERISSMRNLGIETALAEKAEAFDSLQIAYAGLEEELEMLRSKNNQISNVPERFHTESDAREEIVTRESPIEHQEEKKDDEPCIPDLDVDTLLVSRHTFERLHDEVLSTVALIVEKNETIKTLQGRESILKKELKRAMRRSGASDKAVPVTPSPSKKSRKSQRENGADKISSSPKTALEKFITKSTAASKASAAAKAATTQATKPPSPIIAPLRPSNREITSKVAAKIGNGASK